MFINTFTNLPPVRLRRGLRDLQTNSYLRKSQTLYTSSRYFYIVFGFLEPMFFLFKLLTFKTIYNIPQKNDGCKIYFYFSKSGFAATNRGCLIGLSGIEPETSRLSSVSPDRYWRDSRSSASLRRSAARACASRSLAKCCPN